MMKNKTLRVLTLSSSVMAGLPLPVAADSSLEDALKEGQAEFDFRLRYEDVQTNIGSIVKGAQALTLRSRASYETADYNFFSAKLELTNVTALPDDDNYLSGSNGQTDDALVADPKGTELNQVWLAYDVSNTLIKYGRQSLQLDNGRFIGTDTWRQNENTVSGLTVRNETLDLLRVNLGTIYRSEGVLGDDVVGGFSDVDANYLHFKYRGFLNSFLSLYYIDIDNNDGVDVWDSRTQGIRFAGKVDNEPAIEYALEYASQSDSGENPVSYRASYYLFEGAVTVDGVKIGWGREVLGADGNGYFVTPLGSHDSFQGWGNQFWNGGLGNITGGLVDSYLSLGYSWAENSDVLLMQHTFESDDGSVGPGNLGKEWGIHLRQAWQRCHYSVGYTDYQADQFANDSRTIWLSVGANF